MKDNCSKSSHDTQQHSPRTHSACPNLQLEGKQSLATLQSRKGNCTNPPQQCTGAFRTTGLTCLELKKTERGDNPQTESDTALPLPGQGCQPLP